ncbi:uncharacterized protein AMSG_06690 [Thecamonas trahens ATCC 50062]|uniref:FCH domain-containing protein n=1 Tax=Thecamonas trahens ATCC 50062 TaxID=461836 RepID=A0A0L0DEN7_THETB|nr:hypothetical protein AMSG_06690 [Thecamonas trahens ATCC 50062]KNC50792.1 hypothetical protein AMSG_06690 [Thecamonas trahens ATCC 50062]|eukprot:XP_013756750.1 hypothetical protein AMSG_06690 [Thecamonas trahens ATCC 50062]
MAAARMTKGKAQPSPRELYQNVFVEGEGFEVVRDRLQTTIHVVEELATFAKAAAAAQSKYGRSLTKCPPVLTALDSLGETSSSAWREVRREWDRMAEKILVYADKLECDVAGELNDLCEVAKYELRAADKAGAKFDKAHAKAIADVRKKREAFHKDTAAVAAALEALKIALESENDKAAKKAKKKASATVAAARKAELAYTQSLLDMQIRTEQYYRAKAYVVSKINAAEVDARDGIRKYTVALLTTLSSFYEHAGNHVACAADKACLARPERDLTHWVSISQTGRVRSFEAYLAPPGPALCDCETELAELDADILEQLDPRPELPDIAHLPSLNTAPPNTADVVFDAGAFDTIDAIAKSSTRVKKRATSIALDLGMLKAAVAQAQASAPSSAVSSAPSSTPSSRSTSPTPELASIEEQASLSPRALSSSSSLTPPPPSPATPPADSSPVPPPIPPRPSLVLSAPPPLAPSVRHSMTSLDAFSSSAHIKGELLAVRALLDRTAAPPVSSTAQRPQAPAPAAPPPIPPKPVAELDPETLTAEMDAILDEILP